MLSPKHLLFIHLKTTFMLQSTIKLIIITIMLLSIFFIENDNNTYTPTIKNENHNIKDEINNDIIEVFFGGDTTNISKTIYML
jgi:hypothetical protein